MSERDKDSLNSAEKNYNDKFGFNPSANERTSTDQSRNGLSNAEQTNGQPEKKAIADTTAGKAAIAAASASGPVGKVAAQLLGRLKTKEGGVGVVIAAVIMMFGAVGFFSTFLAPVAFMEGVIDDLNDQLAALDIRQERMMRAKVSYDERNQAFKGCTKLSIRCKAKSLSATQKKNFEEHGIKVNGKTIKFAGVERTFPDSYTYKGQTLKPAEFVNEMKTNNALRLSFKRAVNMKFMGFRDSRFIKWTQAKLGISKKKPVLSGNEDERFKKLASLEGTRVTAETEFVKVANGPDGEERFIISGGDPAVVFSAQDVASITQQFSKLSTMMDSFGKVGTQSLKALSVVGFYDMGCSVKNMIGLAATTTKVLSQYSLAQYAAPIWSMAHAQKASDISAADSTALNNFFLATDQRKKIPSTQASFAAANIVEGKDMPGEIGLVTVDNPDFGANVMDSALYKMSTQGGPPLTNETNIRYSLGMGRTTLLAAVGATAAVVEAILNIGAGDIGCQIVQNWAVRGISFIVGIVAAIASGGSSVAANIAIMAALGAAFMAANYALMSALTNDIIPEDIDKLPSDRAAATWTGLSAITGTAAQARGLMPASSEEIIDYNNLQQASIRDYVAIEREDASFFDFKNPYSPTGGTLLALQDYTPKSYNATDLLASLTSLQTAAVSRPFNQAASAVDYTERFNKCDDDAYEDLGIDADVQCNVRYIMSDADLNRDTEQVINYMESNGHVELDKEIGESVTGLPEGYTPPKPQESASFVKDMASGVANQFYNTRSFGTTSQAEEYGKFLDYCVYRAMPYGNTYEENGGWGAAEKKWLTGEECMSNSEKISNFRVYTLEVTLLDISEEVDLTSEFSSYNGDTGTGTVSGDLKSLAQQILDLEKSGKIVINNIAPQDAANRTLPKQQLEDIAAGKTPAAPTRCGFSVPTPINPDPKLLQFLVNLGGVYKYQINSLFGQCHSQTSNHYIGKAVDFGCPLNTSIADKIGAPFGIKHNYESCAADSHWHYSVVGN